VKYLDVDQVGAILGSPTRAASYWPQLIAALGNLGVDTPTARIVLGANVMAESRMAPIEEVPSGVSGPNFQNYEPGTQTGRVLGNTHPGDGALFRGRGFLQITGRDNYQRIGNQIGIDLVDQPTLLVTSPAVSAAAAVQYLLNRSAFSKGDTGDWQAVRRAVQSGNDPAGMARFLQYVQAMLAATAEQAGEIMSRPPNPGLLGNQDGTINVKLVAALVGLLLGLLGIRWGQR
jgi:hypothetical protein